MDWSRAVRGTRLAVGLTANFTKGSDWGSGSIGHYTVRNDTSTAVQGWTLEFDLPAGERLTSAWSAKLSSSGTHYVLTDEAWTHTIAPGESVEVGFQGASSGQFAAPTECTLDGQPCCRRRLAGARNRNAHGTRRDGTAHRHLRQDLRPGLGVRRQLRDPQRRNGAGRRLAARVDLPSSETIATAWSAKLSRSGRSLHARRRELDAHGRPGSAVKIGFQGTHSGEFAAPENCTLNGHAPCGGRLELRKRRPAIQRPRASRHARRSRPRAGLAQATPSPSSSAVTRAPPRWGGYYGLDDAAIGQRIADL